MNMFEMVGKRLRIRAKHGTDLGLGTFLWDNEILLDKGKKILTDQCVYDVAPRSKVPPFKIELTTDTRVFEGEGGLRNTGYYLPPKEGIEIIEIAVCGWNHGDYVAGKFIYKGEPYWLIMSEVELPMEIPYLQPVA